MLQREVRYLLAAMQAVIAWEWLVSGFNKVLSGTFPYSLSDTLNQGIQGNPNGWYVSFLRTVVLPHSVFFGYFIEWTEVVIGFVLLVGIVFLLIGARKQGTLFHRFSVSTYIAVAFVAAAGAFLCVNFHFWMGKSFIPGLGADPGDEGIDLDALMPALSLIIILANMYIVSRIRNISSREHVAEHRVIASKQVASMH